MSSARFLISGKVQGVFFRASTRDEALKLSLCGYALNLPNGQVEVVAIGSDEALNRLEQWLWQGPPAARVDEVIRSVCDASVTDDFVIR